MARKKNKDSSLIGIENSIFSKAVQSLEMESKCQCSRWASKLAYILISVPWEP